MSPAPQNDTSRNLFTQMVAEVFFPRLIAEDPDAARAMQHRSPALSQMRRQAARYCMAIADGCSMRYRQEIERGEYVVADEALCLGLLFRSLAQWASYEPPAPLPLAHLAPPTARRPARPSNT